MNQPREIAPYAASKGPKVTSLDRVVGATLGAGLLVGALGAGGVLAAIDAPDKADFAIESSQSTVKTDIMDPDDVLSPQDEERMLRDVSRINAPAAVTGLHYMVFATNHDNVNDSVEEYLRDNHPELIGDDKFADGQVFVGVGLDPRRAFVFAGEDVADLLDLRKGDSHLEDSIEEIKPGVRDNNIPAGLFKGASTAIDVDRAAEAQYDSSAGNRIGGAVGAGMGAGALGAVGAGTVTGLRRSRQKQVMKARENWDYVSQTYTDTAQRLQAIDVQAHSLRSGLLDQRLRDDWDTLRDEFLGLDRTVGSFMTMTADSPDSLYRERADEIQQARQACERVETAEENIDKLHRIEHADAEARRYALYDLGKDLSQASYVATDLDSNLAQEAKRLEANAMELAQQPTRPDFMERYMALLDRTSGLSQYLQQQLQKKNKAEQLPERPHLYDSGFYVGVGYNGFVPFSAVHSWDSDATAANSSSSSSGGVNSSFSSGFSGAGGSSSF